jgi:hypothetical protein
MIAATPWEKYASNIRSALIRIPSIVSSSRRIDRSHTIEVDIRSRNLASLITNTKFHNPFSQLLIRLQFVLVCERLVPFQVSVREIVSRASKPKVNFWLGGGREEGSGVLPKIRRAGTPIRAPIVAGCATDGLELFLPACEGAREDHSLKLFEVADSWVRDLAG